MQKTKAVNVITPEGRISYPKLFKPEETDTGELKYGVTLLIPKDGEGVADWIKKVIGIRNELRAQAWPARKDNPPQNFFIKDGDKEVIQSGDDEGKRLCEAHPENAGCWVVRTNTTTKPDVRDRFGKPVTNEGEAYAGRWARISIAICPYEHKKSGKAGVSGYLNNVLLRADAEKFGGGTSADEDFADFFENPQNADTLGSGSADNADDLL